MPRKPTTTPTTPTKAGGDKRRPGGGGGGGGGGGLHLPRATSTTGTCGSPSWIAMRGGGTSPNSRQQAATGTTSAWLGSGSGGASPSAAIIAAPPRAALSEGASSPIPPPEEHRNNNISSSSNSTTSGLKQDAATPTPPTTTPRTPAPAAADTNLDPALLQEKTARIAHLEAELALMESEFTQELDKLSAAECETLTFWQARYSALNQQFLRTDTDLRLLRAELESRDRERDEVVAALSLRVRERDDENRALRVQIRGLKEWVSTSTRSDGGAQVSDEVFGDGMGRLGNGLQNWVVGSFRRAKVVDLSKVDEEILVELGRLVPMYEGHSSISKVHLIQSLVSRLLVESVFDTYFVGLSNDETQQLTHMETFLSSFATTPEPINQWRSVTLTILKREADQKMQKEAANVTENLVSKVNTILDAVTDTKTTESRDQGLRALVGSAIELSRLLVVQRAVFKVTMPEILPHQRIIFDPTTMEDIGGEDEDSLEEREICCVTFPGIIKRGDENGGHLQYRNVISKARVLCSPE